LRTERLELRPLPITAAHALPHDRETAARAIGATLSPDWPLPDLLDILPLQDEGPFGVWIMVELENVTVVGDVGFIGPPGDDGVVEIGYSVVPDRRRRGYATEAGCALTYWALGRSGIETVVAGCARDNAASIRTLERIGFERTDESAGEIRWQIRR
jgi:RimJ/RimL family protein N-acetyltransferase